MVGCSSILTPDVCWGFVDTSAHAIVDSWTGFLLSPNYFCENVMLACETKEFAEMDPNDFIRGVILDKPEHVQDDMFLTNIHKQVASSNEVRKTLKMAHFTDLHIDLLYKEGANKNCNNILCCRERNGFPVDKNAQAGRLGSYNCDVPVELLYSMGDFIKEEINPDVIFWTGDVPPHDQWMYSEEYIKTYQSFLADYMSANFSDYSIHVLEGNHDFVVPNSQDFKQSDPLLQFNMEIWDKWLDAEAKEIYKEHGFYSTKLKTSDGQIHDKVNIVAINTQVCYHFNYFLWATLNDPASELVWLEKTFREIEKRGEIAIVIGHIPPGDSDCLSQWSMRYRAITDRFQHLIRFSIYGHVHKEQYGIARSFSTGKPVGVQHWTGSVSTFVQINPSFRMFEVDAETMVPVKIHTYILDIKEENPKWKWDHELTEYYNMTDLSP